MTKEEALKAAQRAVMMPMGAGTSWVVIGPCSASRDATGYLEAREVREKWVEEIALGLTGLGAMV